MAAAAVAAAVAAPSFGQTQGDARSGDGGPVAVIVKVPKPWYAPRSLVVSKMRETIPQYEAIPGLAFKAFFLARDDGKFGGVYLWRDRASAQAWFNAAWFERVEKERGAKGEVRYFDVPVAIDNTPGGTPRSDDSSAVATLVTIATPPGVGRDRLAAEFDAAVPVYRQVKGLLRKYFILTGDGRFGGIYLWSDPGSAERWFNAAWHERVRKTYGEDARIEWFDTPILLPGKAANADLLARP
jgi:Putative mono-oxygenase ydhR